jgi:hypothetical protein
MNTSARRIFALSLVLAAPSAVILTAAPAAQAADASASPAKDDIALTGGQVIGLEKKLKDPTDWASDAGKRDSAKTAVEGVESGLKRIKSKDPKWDVSAWETLVKTGRARLKKAQDAASAKEASDEANESAYRDYVAKLSGVREGFDLLVKLDGSPSSVKVFSKNQIVGNMAKALAGVDALDKACKQKSYEKLTVPSFYKNEPVAAGACKLAAKWKELGKIYLDHQVKGGVPQEVARLEAVMAAAKKGAYVEVNDHNNLTNPDKHIERYRKDYDAAAKLFGATVESSAFEPITAAAKSYADTLAEAQKTFRFDTKAKFVDAGATASVAKHHKKGGPSEGQVIKVASAYDWSVKTNILGTPVSRERDVTVLVKLKGESFCRVYFRNAFQAYKGAWKPVIVSGGESKFRVSACK